MRIHRVEIDFASHSPEIAAAGAPLEAALAGVRERPPGVRGAGIGVCDLGELARTQSDYVFVIHAVEGELPGLPIQTSASTMAVRDADGTWRVPLHFAFVEDTRTYASAEFYELMLLLELADGSPRVRGAYRKLNEAGYWIRLGLLEAARDVAPHPKTIRFDTLTCAARCLINCAGARAEQECLDRNCAALDNDPADHCGPPSYDFPVPMRAKATREALRDGKDTSRWRSIAAVEPSSWPTVPRTRDASRVSGGCGSPTTLRPCSCARRTVSSRAP